jgi:hypothetical protein
MVGGSGQFGPLIVKSGLARLGLALLRVLEVPGLRLDEEAVDHRAVHVGKHAEIGAEPQQRQEVHRLARAEQVAVLEDAVGAPDLVEHLARIAFEQLGPGVQLVLDDGFKHAAQALDDVLLGLAEGRLVGNLEDAAARVGTLAEEPAHDHAQLVHGAHDLLHLPGDDQRGQVHHGGGPHAGAEIGRAGRQVAQRRRKGVVQLLLQRGVELGDGVPRLPELESGAQHLDAEVVLLVDHHGERLVLADDHARPALRAAEFAADQVALDEDLAFQLRELVDGNVQRPLHLRGAGDRPAAQRQQVGALGLFGPAGKGPAREIARQAHAGHEHDRGLVARGVGQLGRRVDERGDRHGISARAFR